MNKKILLTTIALFSMSVYGITYAVETVSNTEKGAVKETVQTIEQSGVIKPDKEIFQSPPPKGEFRPPRHGKMNHVRPSKAEMEKKKAEFEKRLKLTDEQKKKIDENRKQGHDKVKPIFEQKHAKIKEIDKIFKDTSLTKEQKQEKITSIKAEIKKLDEQADSYRKENMKAFENILTKEQKAEFSKIKEEQKKDMEKRRAEFQKIKNKK